ncbi:MAG: polyprenyl synthetase [Vicingaceae bacterium]|nr:MAG: polyprenyl synthetase [Vicingaceae bacterium]
MALFESYFKNALKSHVPLLDTIMHYIVKRKGKQLRPMLVFLSARMHGDVNQSTYIAASLIELLHTATLVHDDVVDESYYRRGFFSINALWKNKIAVLVGDYLLSKGLLLSLENKEYDMLQILSGAVKMMSEGELLQLEKARRLDITEEIYYQIIEQKTAALIAACCAAGTLSVTKDQYVVSQMYQLGKDIGMAFQIKDDLFDYDESAETGKPHAIDIKERKMTLPLIFTLQNCDNKTKKQIMRIVKNNENDKDKVQFVVNQVIKCGGIAYAENKMNEYKQKALEILKSMPRNPAAESMEMLIEYVTIRKN